VVGLYKIKITLVWLLAIVWILWHLHLGLVGVRVSSVELGLVGVLLVEALGVHLGLHLGLMRLGLMHLGLVYKG
jgi:hypothetical protein